MENKEIHFHPVYGTIDLPDEVYEAREKYWKVVKPYLEKMSIVEIKAFEPYTSLENHFAETEIGRQIFYRKRRK